MARGAVRPVQLSTISRFKQTHSTAVGEAGHRRVLSTISRFKLQASLYPARYMAAPFIIFQLSLDLNRRRWGGSTRTVWGSCLSTISRFKPWQAPRGRNQAVPRLSTISRFKRGAHVPYPPPGAPCLSTISRFKHQERHARSRSRKILFQLSLDLNSRSSRTPQA